MAGVSADGTSCIDHTVLSNKYTEDDGVCDACADGTYSAGGTETTCTPHEVTSCAPGQSYTPATNIEDGRCDVMEPILLVALKLHACHEVTSCAQVKLYTSNKYIRADGTYDGTSCIDYTLLDVRESYTAGTDAVRWRL